jgi:hypothetical protein
MKMRLQSKADYQMLQTILRDAEKRIEQFAATNPDVALRSSETVALCEERMEAAGITRAQLKRLAK